MLSFFPFRFFVPVVLAIYAVSCNVGTFDLDVRLQSPPDHAVVYHGSQVTVQFGNHAPEPPQPLTDDGRATFPKLSRSMLHDTIRLTYLAKNGRPYRVVQQMFYTAADRRQIDFVVEIVPDTTHVKFSLKNKNGLIPNAVVKIDNKIITATDDYGLVDVYVAKTAGSTAHFTIEKDGKTLLDKDLVLTDEYQKIVVEE